MNAVKGWRTVAGGVGFIMSGLGAFAQNLTDGFQVGDVTEPLTMISGGLVAIGMAGKVVKMVRLLLPFLNQLADKK